MPDTSDYRSAAVDPTALDHAPELDWTAALCAQVDPELWFPEKGGPTVEAKAVCAKCLLRRQCLEYALSHDERFGIWGGLSERERRPLRRALKRGRHYIGSIS